MQPIDVEMDGVREYNDELPVKCLFDNPTQRLCVVALNEAGHCSTWVDLLDLLAWLRKNRPDLLDAATHEGS